MAGNYVLLETINLTQSTSSVTFDNIPQSGYTDLKLVVSCRENNSGGGPWGNLAVTFNGSTSGYSERAVYKADAASGTGASGTNSSVNAFRFFYTSRNDAVANSFSNSEMYIPNYASSNYKTVSYESVVEHDSTAGWIVLSASGLWSNTSAITSINIASYNAYNLLADSTFSLYGLAATGTTPTVAPKATGGNIVANDGTYWYHAFTTSGTFTPQTALTCDVLAVAGGGGGGDYGAGGGGAGGVVYWASRALSNSSQAVTIGAGGAKNTNGTNTTFASLTAAIGGGKGSNANGTSGGSGGGGGYSGGAAGTSTQTGTGATAFYGNSSGTSGSNIGGAGGGGAGSAGGNGSSSAGLPGGVGGAGINVYSSWLSPTNLGVSGFIAGGGAGGGNTTSGAAGGSGGGGNGGFGQASWQATNGVASTGSGGGGGGYAGTSPQYDGASGGSGIVIIRYAM